MLEALHFTAAGQRSGSHQLPAEYDGVINQWALHHAVRAYLNNQRHGTHATKTRGLVSGGNQKPWRQKGTGRARQGSIRAPQWPGGGTVFGPMPRSYHTDLNRKVRRLARRSALNARATGGQIYVIERLDFERPKTRQMANLLEQLGLTGQKVLVLTNGDRPEVYLSGRNIPDLRVMPYQQAAAYDVLWADAVVVEESAVGGRAVAGASRAVTARAKRAERAAKGAARSRAAARKPAAKTTSAKPAKKAQALKKQGAD